MERAETDRETTDRDYENENACTMRRKNKMKFFFFFLRGPSSSLARAICIASIIILAWNGTERNPVVTSPGQTAREEKTSNDHTIHRRKLLLLVVWRTDGEFKRPLTPA